MPQWPLYLKFNFRNEEQAKLEVNNKQGFFL